MATDNGILRDRQHLPLNRVAVNATALPHLEAPQLQGYEAHLSAAPAGTKS